MLKMHMGTVLFAVEESVQAHMAGRRVVDVVGGELSGKLHVVRFDFAHGELERDDAFVIVDCFRHLNFLQLSLDQRHFSSCGEGVVRRGYTTDATREMRLLRADFQIEWRHSAALNPASPSENYRPPFSGTALVL